MINNISAKKIRVLVIAMVTIAVIGFLLSGIGHRNIDIVNQSALTKMVAPQKSPLTGTQCASADSRPFAVMLSSDKEARPLSGIGDAEMVFEMPVVDTGFTRMMAIYQCDRPKELGSVRSSRLDFVPLALGLNAIYAHFGGEKEVLEELNSGIIDNIDGLKYDGTVYYRKKSIPKPHNAFTNFNLLAQAVSQLGYNTSGTSTAYTHEESKSKGNAEPLPLFNKDFEVLWKYNPETNSYSRSRAGKPETDKNTGKQVEAKNIVIMKTTWSPINKDYIRVKTVGSGGLLVYKNGAVVTGNWEKKDDRAKLYFYNQNHKEIPFVPGSIWIEVDAH